MVLLQRQAENKNESKQTIHLISTTKMFLSDAIRRRSSMKYAFTLHTTSAVEVDENCGVGGLLLVLYMRSNIKCADDAGERGREYRTMAMNGISIVLSSASAIIKLKEITFKLNVMNNSE